jgi:hypothetical protein
VLPAELLHSQYAKPVVHYLTRSFTSVTIAVWDKRSCREDGSKVSARARRRESRVCASRRPRSVCWMSSIMKEHAVERS